RSGRTDAGFALPRLQVGADGDAATAEQLSNPVVDEAERILIMQAYNGSLPTPIIEVACKVDGGWALRQELKLVGSEIQNLTPDSLSKDGRVLYFESASPPHLYRVVLH